MCQGREGDVSLSLHGQLNVLVVKEVAQPVESVWPGDENVVHVTEAAEGLMESPVERVCSKFSVKNLAMIEDSGEPTPSFSS
jgi:hypothetical protein